MDDQAEYVRSDCAFLSRGTRCHAWLYRPVGVNRPPIVVMGHGFAGEKTFHLGDYAERFAANGLAVLVFDYRNFGASAGEPRNLVSHFRHLDDWQAAVAYARSLEGIDAGRVGFWGTSYSGGAVIVTAARDGNIAALVAQVPMVDVPSSLGRFGLTYTLQAAGHGLWDFFQSLLLGRPHEVPVVGPPGRFAILSQPGCEEGYRAIIPADANFRNRCPARVLLTSLLYRPAAWASRVNCPALIILAERDQLIPPATIRRAAARMPAAEIMALDLDHFQHYQGEVFEQVVRRETAFFARTLCQNVEQNAEAGVKATQ